MWLNTRTEEAARQGCPILNERLVRVSTKQLEAFRLSFNTSMATAERSGDPDVIEAERLGYNVVRRDEVGDYTREQLGDAVFELRMHHLPGGVGRERLGVILHIGQTLFVYLLSSARDDNLEAPTDDRKGNAATEVISAVVRAMAAAGRDVDGYRPHVYAREHERVARDEAHGAAIKRTFIQYKVIAHLPHTLDMTNSGDQANFGFGTLMAAHAAALSVKSMTRAVLVMLADGATTMDPKSFPFTHGPQRLVERIPGTNRVLESTNPRRAAVVEDVSGARGLMIDLVRAALHDPSNGHEECPPLDWDAVVRVAVKHGLPSRSAHDLKRGLLIRDKGEQAQLRCVKSLFADEWINAWRTGKLATSVTVKDDELKELDLPNVVRLEHFHDGSARFHFLIDFPLPDDGLGWGVSDRDWEELRRRRDTESPPRAPRTGLVHPFAGLKPTAGAADGHKRKLMTKNGYVLFRRPSSATGAWGGNEDFREASIRPSEMHVSLAAAATEALTRLDEQVEVLPMPVGVRAGTPASPLDGENQLAELKEACSEAEEIRAEADDARIAAAVGIRRGTATDLDLERAEHTLAKAQRRADKALTLMRAFISAAASSPAAEPIEQEVQASTGEVEFVIAALTACSGTAPVWLRETCHHLFVGWTMSVRPVEGGRDQVDWTCVMQLDIAGEQVPLRVPLAGSVPNRMNASSGARASTGPDDWAWSYFYGGSTMEQIGAACNIAGDGSKNSHLYKGLHAWLSGAVANTHLLTAALLCPIPVTRRVLWATATGDSTALTGIDEGFARHIETVYRAADARPSWTWARETHLLARRVANYLAGCAGGSAPEHELVAAVKTSMGEVNRLLREHRSATGKAFQSKTVAYFTKSYRFGVKHPDPILNTVQLRPCPHADCPARLRGGQAYCSIVLSTPETDPGFGVLCEQCLRLPVTEFARVWFPEDYRRPWSAPYGVGSRALGKRQRHGLSYLDVSSGQVDPGAAAALPDVGCLPAPPVRTTAADRADPGVVGPRVLVEVGGSAGQLQDLVREHGGVVAARLTPSVDLLVVDETVGGERRVRAESMDVRVVGADRLSTELNRWATRRGTAA